jgi:hypothetical protein
MLTLEVRASSADAARLAARELVTRVHAAAGLLVDELQVLWVAPLDLGHESSHRFLDEARDLFDEERFELAVVAAQIHLELHLVTWLRMFAAADPSAFGAALLASRIEWTQMQPWQRDLFEQLIGRNLSKDFPEWKRYDTHVRRRNAVVHQGQTVDRESAADSIVVVSSSGPG